MPGPAALSSSWAPAQPSSSSRAGKRRLHNVETEPNDHTRIPASYASKDPMNTKPTEDTSSTTHHNNHSRKRRHVGPSTSSIPRTLPMESHNELISELQNKYSIITTSVISSSKIQKKVNTVLSHLGHVDLFNAEDKPGVMMLHARAGDAGKMVTVIELAKRRMGEVGVAWYQYNRVYQTTRQDDKIHSKGASRGGRNAREANETVVEGTVMGEAGPDSEEESDEEEGFEPVDADLYAASQDKPSAEPKATYMSIFLSRVPIPELQSKNFVTLQTNAGEVGRGRTI